MKTFEQFIKDPLDEVGPPKMKSALGDKLSKMVDKINRELSAADKSTEANGKFKKEIDVQATDLQAKFGKMKIGKSVYNKLAELNKAMKNAQADLMNLKADLEKASRM
ncbi:MAG: hypothetical protein KAS32_24160 [Candidatus Peribacteraceae bacterium]|nr:hypothetical protein [Candidatus Peribacteraceae bacterium]